MAHHVLVVEGDPLLAARIEHTLCERGHEVVRAHRGEDAFFLAMTQPFGAMVLDWQVPGRGGLAVLQALRARQRHMAVLALIPTHRADDCAEAQRCGANDCLVKPCDADHLSVRLTVLLQREQACLRLADLHIDLRACRVTRASRTVSLTSTEYKLLETLMLHARRVVSRGTLLRNIWKVWQHPSVMDNVIEGHIGRLRRKIDLPGMQALIYTVHNIGFLVTDQQIGSQGEVDLSANRVESIS